MSDWQRDDSGLSLRDIAAKPAYKLEPHAFTTSKKILYQRCKRCGLLTLRNALTEWAIRMGCNANDHPEYTARCRATKPRAAA